MTNKIGILDIGSNSIRFVIFEPPYLADKPVFNEKVQCGLGRDLEETGRLSIDGMACTRQALDGFLDLAGAMQLDEVHIVATAALRDAENGRDFAEVLRRAGNYDIRILSGEEEARYSALGVLSHFPQASGIVGDLGGGSLELAAIDGGMVSGQLSLKLGVLRIAAQDDKEDYIRRTLEALPDTLKNKRDFYIVGGTWRALAEAHMIENGRKPASTHKYTVRAKEYADFAGKIMALSKEELLNSYQIEQNRVHMIADAALLLVILIEVLRPENIIISTAGLRDGILSEIVGSSKN